MSTRLRHQLQQDEVEREREMTLALVIALYYYAKGVHNRASLNRPSLHNPRSDSAWCLLHSQRDYKAFIVTMGVNPQTFDAILEAGFDQKWSTRAIQDRSSLIRQGPRVVRHSLDSAGVLGLILHYLNSTMSQVTLQRIFGLTPAMCSRYLDQGIEVLQTLRGWSKVRLNWPRRESEFQDYSDLIERRHGPLLKGAFGFVDRVHLPVEATGDLTMQSAYYNAWVHNHFISNVFTFSPTGIILHACINAPGCLRVEVNSQFLDLVREKTPEGYWLIADSTFPHSGNGIDRRIRVPLKANFRNWPDNPTEKAILSRRNTQLISARQAAKWSMRSFQGSFGRLKMPLPSTDNRKRREIIECCCRLHQIRVREEGINQIQSVYESTWREYGKELYESFGRMRFSDIRRYDRVARYYHSHVY